MPSLSKLYKSFKNPFTKSKGRKGSNDSGKSVRFSKTNESSIFYTHSSLEYDRKSTTTFDDQHEADSLKSGSTCNEDEIDLFDEEVLRNTKVNRKQGHYSIAALVSYRANI